MKTLSFGGKKILGISMAFIAVLALARIHVRVQATLTGYEIGRLRNEESTMLEERAALKMQLAKLTSKKHLMLMTDAADSHKIAPQRAYAQQ